MKKTIFFKYIFCLLLIIILILAGWLFVKKGKKQLDEVKKIGLGNCSFEVEEAVSIGEREKGLSDRDSICRKCGMLFIFEKQDIYGFWMRNMRFDLDIVWIKDNKVLGIQENVKYDSLNTFYPKGKIDKVLEINSGEAKKCNIKEGENLRLN